MLKIAIISGSLNSQSKSRILADAAKTHLMDKGMDVDFMDLRDYDLPEFDHEKCYENENIPRLTNRLSLVQSIVIATPVYNWSACAAVKKLIEHTGTDDTGRICRAWEDKVVTFLCSGGIAQSYMSFLSTANSLMLDYKCIINPHQVYAVEDDYGNGQIQNPKIQARLERVMDIAVELTDCLKDRKLLSGWSI